MATGLVCGCPGSNESNGPVWMFLPWWVNLNPTYLSNGLSALTEKVPVEWKRNFQNEPIGNSTQNRNSIYLQNRIITWNPSLFFFFQLHSQDAKQCCSHKWFSRVVTMVTGHAQHCHLAVTSPVIVANVRQGECNCRLFAISEHTEAVFRAFWYKRVVKRHRSQTVFGFGCKFVCHTPDLINDPTAGEAPVRTLLP